MVAIGWSGGWTAVVKRTGAGDHRPQSGPVGDALPASSRRGSPHALRGPCFLEGPRPSGRTQSLSPLRSGPSFALPDGPDRPCCRWPPASASAAHALQRIRLRHRELRPGRDRPSAPVRLEPDACWIDAGWYENASKYLVGGRRQLDRQQGQLSPRPEARHRRRPAWGGKRFVLWFEPERVYEGTRIDREHPEWVTKLPGNPNRLFNLGDPKALRWLIDEISGFLKAEGVPIYRQDFNFDPAPYWKAMDAPDRVGIAEMKHIEGLYAFWDGLLAAQPGPAHRQLRLRRPPHRPGDHQPQRAAVAHGLFLLRAQRLPVPHLRPAPLPALERDGQQRSAQVQLPKLHERGRGHGLGARPTRSRSPWPRTPSPSSAPCAPTSWATSIR